MNKIAAVLFWIGITFWIGGLAALTLIAAPTAFRNAPSREVAGTIFGSSLRAFAYVEIACAILAGLGLGLSLVGDRAWFNAIRAAMFVAMIAILLVIQAWIAPAMRGLQGQMATDPAARERFTRLHRISELSYGANLFLGTGLIILSALRRGPL
ncbi:MAG: DUF4149 domain-containing protein [Planctomycetes bacterium]|nr:DUF4149 domain-containing protein [Planctomycetota bacterium]